ncbi:hypothetical protein G9A89_022438 [Geosiphon pyriformis]|nr:hypothetical protein G9A89_022438 [Geosiphon pyriformis]
MVILKADIALTPNAHHRVRMKGFLTDVLQKIFATPLVEAIKGGGSIINVVISKLPVILRDITNRIRISPFEFAGSFSNIRKHQSNKQSIRRGYHD